MVSTEATASPDRGASPDGIVADVAGGPARLDPEDPTGPALRDAIGTAITDFLARQRTATVGLGEDLDPVHRLAAALTDGGKQLRPALCFWGWVAAGGSIPDGTTGIDPVPQQAAQQAAQQAVLRGAASLELLHVSALVHDDVMDGSDLRRGAPSAHRWLEAWHRDRHRSGDPAAFGRSGAILLGDLLLLWSVEMLQRSGLPTERLQAALPIVEAMRTEVTAGQFLDVLAQTQPVLTSDPVAETAEALRRAERVTEFKSARYTVVRPVQLGARLAGGDNDLLARLGEFGSPLGRAFQYRDDLLGVFGDPSVTGKPAGDDLREGKRTVLVAHARDLAGPAGRAELDQWLGRPDLELSRVQDLQALITDCGAVDAVEAMISRDHERAMSALEAAPVTPAGRTALTALAGLLVDRSA